MALLMVTVSALNLCWVGRKIKFSKILLVNFENYPFFSYIFFDCDFVTGGLIFKLRYIFDQLVGASYRPN